MATITIAIDDGLMPSFEKRAKKLYLTVFELGSDIVRRSMTSYKNKTKKGDIKVDDKLINLFSRSKRGRKIK